MTTNTKPTKFLEGKTREFPKRGLTLETSQRWGSLEAKTEDGRTVHVFQYFDAEGNLVAQKVRDADKNFHIRGDAKHMGLYGQQLWSAGGKTLVIVEGERDAEATDQMMNRKLPVVSIPNGSNAAAKAIRQNLEFIESFDKVILMFDMDEPGRKAVSECAGILSPGKVAIASLPLKDANDMLLAGRWTEFRDAIQGAKTYRPDGIILGDEISLDFLKEKPAVGYATPYPGLDTLVQGLRKAELTLFTAGTGVGKSTIVRELGHYLNVHHGLSVGNIFLEESYRKTVQGYIAIDQDIPLGNIRQNPECLTDEQYRESMTRCINNGRTFFYNHFGSLESDNLLNKLQYLAANGVDFILLDHISIVVSGSTSSKEGERKDIDVLMTKLRSLVEQTGIGVIAIAHLSKAEGKSHEEGGRVTLNDLRGSAALKQIPDNIIALERDQQGEHPNQALVRVLKNREFGDLGPAQTVLYDKKTGRLVPIESQQDDLPSDF